MELKKTIEGSRTASEHSHVRSSSVGGLIRATGLAVLAACAPDPSNEPTFANTCDDPAVLHEYTVNESTPPIEVPVCVHYVFPDQASYEASWQEGDNAEEYMADHLERINWEFEGYSPSANYDKDTRILLVQKGDANVIIDAEQAKLFEEYEDEEKMHGIAEEMKKENNKENCVDFYLLPEPVPFNTNMPKAFTTSAPYNSPTGIVSMTTDSDEVAHEFGHVLGLKHTHETKYGSSVEHPEEPYTTGDLLADTPPDPGPSGWDYATDEYTAGCTLDEEYNYETGGNDQFLVCGKYPFLKTTCLYRLSVA